MNPDDRIERWNLHRAVVAAAEAYIAPRAALHSDDAFLTLVRAVGALESHRQRLGRDEQIGLESGERNA